MRRALFVVLALAGIARAEPSSIRWETVGEVSAYHDSDAVNVLTPAARASAHDPHVGWSANGSYLVDIISAASVDIVSSASPNWTEVRHAASLGGSYAPGDLGVSASGSISSEPDYLSLGATLGGSLAAFDKNAKFNLSYSYSHDVAGRTGTPFSVYSLKLDRHGATASVELVLDRATTLTPGFDVVFESGRQEKPYRYLPLFDPTVVDQVPAGASVELVNRLRLSGRIAEHDPDHRERYALSARFAHRFSKSTLILRERAYADSWGLKAATSDGRWVFDSGRFEVWPHARFHVQSGVSFWRHAYVAELGSQGITVPRYRTGDRELGPLWSATLGPGARWNLSATPRNLSVVLELEGTYTRYSDALYVDHRWAGFGAAEFEARFR